MRVAIVRSDIGNLYLSDVENTSQRNFSSEPIGQSRYFKKPTDAALIAILTKYGITLITLPLVTLKLAIYPTTVTVDVSSTTLGNLAGIIALAPTLKAACIADFQALVAPRLVETGQVLLSFVYGIMSKIRSAAFQPGGARIGLPVGIGAAITLDDGVTPYLL
jgi:hypothetical protein